MTESRPKATRAIFRDAAIESGDEWRAIDAGRRFTKDQWSLVELGYIPPPMGHWAIICEEGRLLFVANWTAWLVAYAPFESTENEVKLTQIFLTGGSKMADEETRLLLYYLIDRFLLGDESSEPPTFTGSYSPP